MHRLLLFLVIVAIGIQGCTYRAWYEGFKNRERQTCYKHSSQDDIEACLERVEKMSYDQYKEIKKKQVI